MTERWRDVAHIGHAELLTPTPEASLEYFTALLGLTVVAEQAGSWYLRGYGDYESYCLKLTASPSPGLGHMAVRAWSPEALARRVSWLKDAGVPGGWVEQEAGKGPAYEFTDPDGHRIRIYYETSKYVPHAGDRPAMKSSHQRYGGVGANVRRLEHVNLMASDVRACREFWADGLGLRTFEIIRRDDGSEDGAWLSSTVQGHEVIYVRDYLAGAGRLHHLAFWVDSREDVLRAADLMNDAGVPIEAGPSRHIPIQGFYLYTREPGGNRIEICSGGYLGLDPDDNPVIWTPTEYAAKPGWGARLPSTFRTYGTPPLGVPEESVTADWPAPALPELPLRYDPSSYGSRLALFLLRGNRVNRLRNSGAVLAVSGLPAHSTWRCVAGRGDVLALAGSPLCRRLTVPDQQKRRPAHRLATVPGHLPAMPDISRYWAINLIGKLWTAGK